MKTFLFVLISLLTVCQTLCAQQKREVRAVWLTVNHNLDWPHKSAATKSEIETHKAALDGMLDQMKKANINIVFFQTRIRGNMVYPSKIEPQTELIKSQALNFDALQYAIDACHRRGMELHAWVVVYPLGKNSGRLSRELSKSGIVVKYKNDYYINPGNPQTTPYLVKILKEMVSEYNIDGIHFDYIRYPDGAVKFPDNAEYKRFGNGQSVENWRRNNINRFVYAAYDAVKAIKPWVAVSSSVVGMYDFLPEGSRKHWTALHSVYQDPVDWIKKGKHDFIVPMLYNREKMFYPFVKDWVKRCGNDRVIPGLGIYLMDEAGWTAETFTDQIQYLRNNKLKGSVFFRAKNLLDNRIYDKLRKNFYASPALLPVFSKNNKLPEVPQNFSVEGKNNFLYLSWDKQSSENTLFYNVYRSKKLPVDTENPDNLFAVKLPTASYKIPIDNNTESVYYYTVTAYDRFHNESKACYPALFVTGKFEK
jgi:uncharacterized lipoprotein YddW (UPF0748 family)